MNRKRDLDQIGLLYESSFGSTLPSNETAGNVQMDVIKKLNDIGWSVNKLRTIIDGEPYGEVHLSKNEPMSREEADRIIVVDKDGNIDGQPYQAALADMDENEETNDLGLQERESAEDQNPLQNYEDEESPNFAVGDKVRWYDKSTKGMFRTGEIVEIRGDEAYIDYGVALTALPLSELQKDEDGEDGEDLGPNQQPESWGDEASGEEQPGISATRFDQDEETVNKESYHSRADRDWSILSENYLNIRNYE